MRKTALAVPDALIHKGAVPLREIFLACDFMDTAAVIVAVSGGSDSMALLLMVHAYLADMDNSPRLVAVTVDHGLRREAVREAEQVAAFCAERAIAHKIVCWEGEKPQSGLMERARHVRYQLLCDQARLHGARVIFTGHTLDDQAETYLMRAARLGKSQPVARGLSAMARQSWLCGGFRLIRPLLEMRRHALRHFLQRQHVRWIEDPSNEDQRFERVRLRQSVDESTILAATVATRQAAEQRAYYNERAIEWMRQGQLCRLAELYQLDLTPLHLDDEFLTQLLADLASLVGGAQYLRPVPPILKTWLQHDISQRVTWAGAVIERRGSFLLLWRERRNLRQIVVPAGTSLIWDRRYRIVNEGNEDIVIRGVEQDELEPLTAADAKGKAALVDGKNARGLYPTVRDVPAAYLLATPAVLGSKGVDLPVLHGRFLYNRRVTIKRILQPFEFLISGTDAAFVNHLRQIFSFATICS